MAGKLAQLLEVKADLENGNVKLEQIPVDAIFSEKLIGVNKIILSSTEPQNPQIGDLWIDTS